MSPKESEIWNAINLVRIFARSKNCWKKNMCQYPTSNYWQFMNNLLNYENYCIRKTILWQAWNPLIHFCMLYWNTLQFWVSGLATFVCMTFVCMTFVCMTIVCMTFVCKTFVCMTFVCMTFVGFWLSKCNAQCTFVWNGTVQYRQIAEKLLRFL